MEGYASREPFDFAMALIVPTIRPTTVNTWVVDALQHILTASLITVDIFVLFVPYLFSVWFSHNNYDCLGQQISAMIPYIPINARSE